MVRGRDLFRMSPGKQNQWSKIRIKGIAASQTSHSQPIGSLFVHNKRPESLNVQPTQPIKLGLTIVSRRRRVIFLIGSFHHLCVVCCYEQGIRRPVATHAIYELRSKRREKMRDGSVGRQAGTAGIMSPRIPQSSSW